MHKNQFPRYIVRVPYLFAPGLAILCLVLAPILLCPIPPLNDYPFHLARTDILASLLGPHQPSPIGRFYAINTFLLPNIAMDLALLAVTPLLPPVVAGQLFLMLTAALLLGGAVALHRAIHRRYSIWPLLAAFFIYNWIFYYGFINYLFGVAIMLWGTAAWIALQRASPLARVTVGTCFAIVILFCHLVAFGLFSIVIGGLALSSVLNIRRRTGSWPWQPLLLTAVPISVGLLIFVAVSPTASELNKPFEFNTWIGWKPLIAYRSVLSTLPMLDAVTLTPMIVLVLAAAAWRRLLIARQMLIPLGLLALTFLVMPSSISGAQYVDVRMPVVILFVAVAAVDLKPISHRATIAVICTALTLLLVRSLAISADWRAGSAVYAEYIAAFEAIPPGCTVYAATAEPYPKIAYATTEELALWHPNLKHVASLASLGRPVFVPATWANPFQQPIKVQPAYRLAKSLQGDNPFKTPTVAELDQIVQQIREVRAPRSCEHDYLLLVRPDLLSGLLPPTVRPVVKGRTFVLLTIP